MKLKDFDYHLPESMIAQHPLKKRDTARLMVIDRKRKTIIHDTFSNIADYLPKKSLFVVNDSKVVPARLFGKKEFGGREVEIFLLKGLSDGYCYEALMKPLRKIKDDEKIFFNGSGIYARLEDRKKMIVRFNKKNALMHLKSVGHIPLPPYIKREDAPSDRKDYQTVYARHQGSVAAPTAGLHFTNALVAQLKRAGHKFAKTTLHINYGTFKPVEDDDITKHQMHSEDYCLLSRTWQTILRAKKENKPIVSVGTTSCRVLETVSRTKELEGSSNLFIYPGFSFRMVDVLLTNFHLPKSTLLMLVAAFAGQDLTVKAYQEAINKNYRFYSYGDCMIII
ncbi:MAG: tRNA preQ1(34) S-adenosylmethionine ribosyltransferase-isomerase QueA [Candidatus Aceula meridiana]|nr:tRNA preQ1(34) S-adenosylmethionine ribosyltransferase-isomerase QueA [Candidatus Aceula meridiana]